MVPDGGMLNIDSGSILKATTTKRCASSECNVLRNSGSLRLVGWKSGRSSSRAKIFTGDGLIFKPLPEGRSGAVITPAM